MFQLLNLCLNLKFQYIIVGGQTGGKETTGET